MDPRDLEAADVILLYRINTAWTPKAYAILERSILRAWPAMGMGPGALVLLLFMLRTTERRPGEDPRHLTKPPHHNWPAATGRSWRSTMRDITELEAAGFVTRVGKDHRGRTRHRINLEPMRRKAAATYARLGYRMTAADGDTWPVPFWPLHVLSDAPDLLWLWWAYASYDTGARTSKAWPSQARLVAWAGLTDSSALRKRIRRLEAHHMLSRAGDARTHPDTGPADWRSHVVTLRYPVATLKNINPDRIAQAAAKVDTDRERAAKYSAYRRRSSGVKSRAPATEDRPPLPPRTGDTPATGDRPPLPPKTDQHRRKANIFGSEELERRPPAQTPALLAIDHPSPATAVAAERSGHHPATDRADGEAFAFPEPPEWPGEPWGSISHNARIGLYMDPRGDVAWCFKHTGRRTEYAYWLSHARFIADMAKG